MLLVTMAAMMALFAAATYAGTIIGTGQDEILYGYNGNDTIYGRGGTTRSTPIRALVRMC